MDLWGCGQIERTGRSLVTSAVSWNVITFSLVRLDWATPRKSLACVTIVPCLGPSFVLPIYWWGIQRLWKEDSVRTMTSSKIEVNAWKVQRYCKPQPKTKFHSSYGFHSPAEHSSESFTRGLSCLFIQSLLTVLHCTLDRTLLGTAAPTVVLLSNNSNS